MKCFMVRVFVSFMACFVFESKGEQYIPTYPECIQTHYSNLTTCNVKETIDCLMSTTSTTVENNLHIQNMLINYEWCPEYVSQGYCPSLENAVCTKTFNKNGHLDHCYNINEYVQCKEDLIVKCPQMDSYEHMRNEMIDLRHLQIACEMTPGAEQCVGDRWRPDKCNLTKVIDCLEKSTLTRRTTKELQDARDIYGMCPEYVSEGGCPVIEALSCQDKYKHYKGLKNPMICEAAEEAMTCIKDVQKNKCGGLKDNFIHGLGELKTFIQKCRIDANTYKTCLANYWSTGKCNIPQAIVCLENLTPTNITRQELQDAHDIKGLCPDYVSQGGCPILESANCIQKYSFYKQLANRFKQSKTKLCEAAKESMTCIKDVQKKCKGLKSSVIKNWGHVYVTIEECNTKTNTVS